MQCSAWLLDVYGGHVKAFLICWGGRQSLQGCKLVNCLVGNRSIMLQWLRLEASCCSACLAHHTYSSKATICHKAFLHMHVRVMTSSMEIVCLKKCVHSSTHVHDHFNSQYHAQLSADPVLECTVAQLCQQCVCTSSLQTQNYARPHGHVLCQ